MSHAKLAVFVALGILTAVFLVAWFLAARRQRPDLRTLFEILVGFGTNFFDTLGIGSFAPTTALYKLGRMVPDEHIPGTLNVGHTLPTVVQAFIFITIVAIDPTTLIVMIAASVLGAWLGAGVVARWPRRNVQIGMGSALVVAAILFLLTNLGIAPGGGAALALTDGRLAVGLVGNFILGALMTCGVGLYGPCMILVALLGMDPKAAFPIMMGSCAFLMPVASMRFMREGSFALRPALGLALGGIPAVVIAAKVVGSMDVQMMRWLVIVVVLYTASAMLWSAFSERRPKTIP
jgi:uncharacterized membrane protein YfcA